MIATTTASRSSACPGPRRRARPWRSRAGRMAYGCCAPSMRLRHGPGQEASPTGVHRGDQRDAPGRLGAGDPSRRHAHLPFCPPSTGSVIPFFRRLICQQYPSRGAPTSSAPAPRRPGGAPRHSGLRPERACDGGRMAHHRPGPGPAAAGRGPVSQGPTAVGWGSPPRCLWPRSDTAVSPVCHATAVAGRIPQF